MLFRLRVEVNDLFNRMAANCAELISGDHDALLLRTVVTLGLIHGSLERPKPVVEEITEVNGTACAAAMCLSLL